MDEIIALAELLPPDFRDRFLAQIHAGQMIMLRRFTEITPELLDRCGKGRKKPTSIRQTLGLVHANVDSRGQAMPEVEVPVVGAFNRNIAFLNHLKKSEVRSFMDRRRTQLSQRLSENPSREELMEYHSLRVFGLQQQLRKTIATVRHQPDLGVVPHPKPAPVRSARSETEARFSSVLPEMKEACRSAANAHAEVAKLRLKVCTAISQAHARRKERVKKKREEQEKSRLRALRDNNVEEYLKYVNEAKKERLGELIRWTEKMTSRIQQQISEYQASGDVSLNGIAGPLASTEDNFAQQPTMVSGGELRGYQLEGVKFLVSLYNNGINGILADEMGLGKTVQAIATIAYLAERKGLYGPHLVVCPLSVVDNWLNEFAQWAPNLKCMKYHGSKADRKAQKERIFDKTDPCNVVVTTFEMVRHRHEKNVLSKVSWQYLIVDEGHQLKNQDSLVTRTLSLLYKSQRRVLLTGTPLQNSLRELWSLLNFIMPSVFDSADNFEEWFNAPFLPDEAAQLTAEEMNYLVRQLHAVLRPFLLRREHASLEHCLPPKSEVVVKCDMSAIQWSIYSELRQRMLRDFGQDAMAPGASTTSNGPSMLVNKSIRNSFFHFRKVCSHPFLFFQDPAETFVSNDFDSVLIRSSGKFCMLARMLPKLHAAGHKVLVFSQQVRVLDWLADLLAVLGFSSDQYTRLDGQTKGLDRSQRIADFSSPHSPIWLFLISTKAGGLGVNLQAADTVIIFDLDWNPQNDVQAIARAYRIGQTRPVRVFCLISNCPFEQKLYNRWSSKKLQTKTVIECGQFDLDTMMSVRDNVQRQDFANNLEEQRKLIVELMDINSGGGAGVAADPESSEVSEDDLNQLLARDDEDLATYRRLGTVSPVFQVFHTEDAPVVKTAPQVTDDVSSFQGDRVLGRGGRRGVSVLKYQLDDGLSDFLSADSADSSGAESTEDLSGLLEGGKDALTPVGGTFSWPGYKPVWRTKFESLLLRSDKLSGTNDNFSEDCGVRASCASDNVVERLAFIFEQLKSLECGGSSVCIFFLDKPDPRLFPDYYAIFKSVVCLRDIASKIRSQVYDPVHGIFQMEKDVDVMTGNSLKYNEPGSFAWNCARLILVTFRYWMHALFEDPSEPVADEEPSVPSSPTNVDGVALDKDDFPSKARVVRVKKSNGLSASSVRRGRGRPSSSSVASGASRGAKRYRR